MWRLFEGGYYSKYRRRGYYLFQLYHNVATIRGRLLFEVQTPRLLFISALPQCGDYLRAATIRSTDAAAATIYFSSTTMWRLFEGSYYSKYRRRGYYLFQLYHNVATIWGRLLFEVQTPRLLFISALPQCGDYSRAATIRSTDAAATIYFSSTTMWRLFEGGYYSKYRRRRGYYLFQLYHNVATIRGQLLFEVQTPRLLFISALPQCGDYLRAATIRSTDVAATIYFSSTAMERLFEGGYYSKYRRRSYYLFQLYHNVATIWGRLLFEVQTSRLLFISALPQCGDYLRAATIRSTDVAATIYFSSTTMWRLFEGGYYSKYRRRGYYLFQLYHNVATIWGRLLFEVQTSRLLFISALPQCGDYLRAATIRSTDVAATIYFSSTTMWRLFEGGYYSKYRRRGYYLFQLYHNVATIWGRLLFEVQTPRLLFISALPQCGDYSRAATIRSTDAAATIYFSSTTMWRLFEGGYYSKYRRRGYYLFQLYHNVATIWGRLLFEVQTSRLLFISALPQWSDYSRAATIRSTDVAATIYFSSTTMWRLFEGGYYSKYRRRGYYLFQLYHNVATIWGRLLFEVQTSRLLFISALPQCGDYLRAATIRSTDAAATIYFSSTTMWRLFEGGYYSKYRRRGYYLFQLYHNVATIWGRLLFEVQTPRLLFISALPQCGDYLRAATIRSTDAAATIYFSSTTMWRLFEGGYYSKYRRRGYYLFQLYHNVATIWGRLLFEVQTPRLLFISALPQCGDYLRAATIRSTDVAATIYFSSTTMWRLFEGGYYSKYRRRGYYLFQLYHNVATIWGRLLFEVQTPRLLFISALPQCGDYLRAATIRSTDAAATIYFSSTTMWRLFEGGYYSKYRRCGYYLFQLYHNVATIWGRLLFEVQTPRLLFISALPQCGDYLRAATIRSTDAAATIYFSSTAMERLFEGGYYSKYRRRGYYLFQLYRNGATIRGRLLFEVQTPRLFISALPQCGDYSRAATIRSTDVVPCMCFHVILNIRPMWYFLLCNTNCSTWF